MRRTSLMIAAAAGALLLASVFLPNVGLLVSYVRRRIRRPSPT